MARIDVGTFPNIVMNDIIIITPFFFAFLSFNNQQPTTTS
jgi:hypothetical protein